MWFICFMWLFFDRTWFWAVTIEIAVHFMDTDKLSPVGILYLRWRGLLALKSLVIGWAFEHISIKWTSLIASSLPFGARKKRQTRTSVFEMNKDIRQQDEARNYCQHYTETSCDVDVEILSLGRRSLFSNLGERMYKPCGVVICSEQRRCAHSNEFCCTSNWSSNSAEL